MLYISIFSVLVPLLLGIILYNKLEMNSRWLMVLLTVTTIPHMAALIIPGSGRFIYYNLFSIFDALFWAFLFYINSRSKKIRFSIILLASVQAAIFFILINSIGITTRFLSEFVCLNSLVQLLLVLSFFYERYTREEILALEKEPMFWFCVGILLYAPTTYFHFAFYDLITSRPDLNYDHLSTIHHYLNTSMYLIFSIGIFSNLKRRPINVLR